MPYGLKLAGGVYGHAVCRFHLHPDLWRGGFAHSGEDTVVAGARRGGGGAKRRAVVESGMKLFLKNTGMN
jgi:hypothetical protein